MEPKLIRSEPLELYTDGIQEWEEKCEAIRAEIIARTEVVRTEVKGYQVVYANGKSVKYSDVDAPKWAKQVGVVSTPFGEAESQENCWVEEYKKTPYIEMPQKPTPKGFRWNSKSAIADLINEILGFSWSWIDVPTPIGGCYTVPKYTKEVLRKGTPYERGDREDGYYVVQEVYYRHFTLTIYPDKWELYETERMETEFVGRKPAKVSSSSNNYGVGNSWSDKGYF